MSDDAPGRRDRCGRGAVHQRITEQPDSCRDGHNEKGKTDARVVFTNDNHQPERQHGTCRQKRRQGKQTGSVVGGIEKLGTHRLRAWRLVALRFWQTAAKAEKMRRWCVCRDANTSGCHCRPSTNSCWMLSIPSMTPSSATAL